MKDALETYELLYLSGKRMAKGNQGGTYLRSSPKLVNIEVARSKSPTLIVPNPKFVEALGIDAKLTKLVLRSVNFAWVKPMLEGIRRKGRESSDGAETWLEAA